MVTPHSELRPFSLTRPRFSLVELFVALLLVQGLARFNADMRSASSALIVSWSQSLEWFGLGMLIVGGILMVRLTSGSQSRPPAK